MKIRFVPTLVLLAVLLAACASQAVTEAPAQPTEAAIIVQPSATLMVDIPSSTPEMAPTEVLAPTALPVATSRGPDLHATDPSTVSLAAGQIQLVEFFRFT